MGPLSIPQTTHEWTWSSGGMILTGENRRTRRKTCTSATLSTTDPKWTALGANPATNHPELCGIGRLLYLVITGDTHSWRRSRSEEGHSTRRYLAHTSNRALWVPAVFSTMTANWKIHDNGIRERLWAFSKSFGIYWTGKTLNATRVLTCVTFVNYNSCLEDLN
jgi:hypothetical protein